MALGRCRGDRRRIGAFYTPEHVAMTLVAWANPDPSGRILDPSFGGCSFLSAAIRRAKESGVEPSGVFGVDIDIAAFRFAAELTGRGLLPTNVIQRDFFDVSVDTLGGRFAAVVGNPPYIRHHWLDEEQKASARLAAKAADVLLPLTADAWAYFVAHATSFLSIGGRLAFVLPTSVIHARYSDPVLYKLRNSFAEIRLIRVAERLFSATQVQSVIVACSGYGQGPGSITLTDIERIVELEAALSEPPSPIDLQDRRDWGLLRMSRSERAAWHSVVNSRAVTLLGSIADIRIGVVTGANRFFVQSTDVANALIGPGCQALGVVERAGDLRTPLLCDADLSDTSNGNGRRLLAISHEIEQLEPHLQRLILEAEENGLHLRSHTSRRDVWYQLTDTAIPDAFLPYMGTIPRPITMNQAQATSTNGVHRLWWYRKDNAMADAIVGSWTSLFRLSAELNGRQYGGGVLKLEPADVRRLLVPVVDGASTALPQLDSLVRAGRLTTATALADDVVLSKGLHAGSIQVSQLRSAADSLARNRRALS